jgi:hypothetical protein
MNGIRQRLQQAKREKWPKEEVQLLNRLSSEANERVIDMTETINKTPMGARQNAKYQINQSKISIKSFAKLLEMAEAECRGREYKEVLEKSLKKSYSQKEEAERVLENMDGLD